MNPLNIKTWIQTSYLDSLPVPDSPGMDERILRDACRAMEESLKASSASPKRKFWRIVMQSRIAKLTAAAAAVIIILVSYTALTSKDKSAPSVFTLLSQAGAAEEAFFRGEKIVHIINEIIVYPVPQEAGTSQRMQQLREKLRISPEQQQYLQNVNSWLDFNWIPVCSLKADGSFGFHQLQLNKTEQTYAITDESWFDPATGRFARIMETADHDVIFANSFDGRFVYTYNPSEGTEKSLVKEPVTEGFIPPREPAQFLGIAAGFKSSLPEDGLSPVEETLEETLDDGTPVFTYKVGFKKLTGELDTYWLFRQRQDNHTIAEMEFIMLDQPQLFLRRVVSGHLDSQELAWDLSQISNATAPAGESANISITPDMVIPNVSVQHMAEKADYETYIFQTPPSWTKRSELTDCLDLPSPPHRMFMAVYHAADGRDVVLVQAYTYNKMMGNIVKKARLLYTSANGFKVWSGGPEKWWTNILLSSASLKPSEDRTGYVLESPAGTFPALAINGKLTEEELHSLVDSLIPAKEYESKP